MTSILATAAIVAGSHLIARTADQGLAHTLGLATLRHGTNPLFWLSIHTVGFFPSMGGSKLGGDGIIREIEQNKNHVFFAVDAEEGKSTDLLSYLKNKIIMRLMPRGFCASSCVALIGQNLKNIKIKRLLCCLPIILASQLIPTIKVRMDPEKAKSLKTDPSLGGWSVYTDEWVSPLQIGLLGTLWNGLSYKVVQRIYDNPSRCITGIALLAVSASAAYATISLFPAAILANKVAIVAAVAFAVI